MKRASAPVLVGVDYRGGATFGCDYELACRLCDSLSGAGRPAILFNINASLRRTLSRWEASIFFVLADTFSPKSPNAKRHPQPFGLRKALELAGRRFVGSTFEAVRRSSSADKIAARSYLAKKVSVPRAEVAVLTGDLRQKTRDLIARLDLPLVIKKPLMTGSSIGVHYVDSAAGLERVLRQFRRDGLRSVLAETFIAGREFTTWIIERGGAARCYGTEEIIKPKGEPIFTRAGKHLAEPVGAGGPRGSFFDCPRFESPPRLPAALLAEIEGAALAAHQALGLRHYSRVDLILRGRVPLVIEVNARPQLRDGGLGYVAATRGETLGSVLAGLVEEARRETHHTCGASNEALLHP